MGSNVIQSPQVSCEDSQEPVGEIAGMLRWLDSQSPLTKLLAQGVSVPKGCL